MSRNASGSRQVTVCGHAINHSTHICALFESEEQEFSCLAPYFAEGLEQGEQVFTIRNAMEIDQYVERLGTRMSSPLRSYINSRQFRLMTSEESYLAQESFDADRMIEALKEVLRETRAAGYRRVRTAGDMRWAVDSLGTTAGLMEYEARVNELTPQHDCTFMCIYDQSRMSGQAMMDVLSTHPMVLMGSKIYENPYYVEPAVFLEKLRRRGSATPIARSTTPPANDP